MTSTAAAYDHLPVGVAVLRDTRLTYANATAGSLLAMSVADLVGVHVEEVIPGAMALIEAKRRHEGPEPAALWIVARGDRTDRGNLRIVATRSETRGEWLLTLVDADAETATFPLAEAMVSAAGQFARCAEEQGVYDQAVQSLYERGYYATLMVVEPEGKPEYLRVVAMRENAKMLELGAQLYGVAPEAVLFELARVPYVSRCFDTGRAAFHADAMEVMRAVHPPQVAEMIGQVVGPMRMVDAPVFVHGAPFGLLSVQGSQLTPASTATVELYARLLGGAVENVRHQREAATRLQQVSELQRELLARERLAAVGQAAGLLSHEARNPLGAILNALAVLRRRGGADEGSRELIDIAEEEALRLDALVKDLLELARPLEPRLRAVPVEAAVAQAVAALKRRTLTMVPEVDVQLAPDLPQVTADPTLLGVALDNLLRNAMQAGAGAPVRVVATFDGARVTVAVQDAGPPGGRTSSDDAFDPFSLEATRGTGLGLAVVKRVADAQGATVRAARQGTRLELSFPAAPSDG